MTTKPILSKTSEHRDAKAVVLPYHNQIEAKQPAPNLARARSEDARTIQKVHSQTGMTLLELTMATFILLILSTAAIPLFRNTVVREKEYELRRDLREMRNAIDRYKDTADRNAIITELGSEGYPKDLETLVNGVTTSTSAGAKTRFLRRIPFDPMTGKAEWSTQSIKDDPDSTSGSGTGVFDVHSESQGIALDGTPYAKW
jgi:general secretion pathway protein G